METKQIRILFIGEAVTASHVLRPLKIATNLNLDECKVFFSCDHRNIPKNLPKEISFFHLGSITSEQFRSRVLKGQPAYTKAEIESYVDEELHLYDRIKPDIIISDFRVSVSTSASIRCIYHISLSNAQWSPLAEISTPVPELPIIRHCPRGLFNRFKNQLISHHLKPFNVIRKRFDLEPFQTLEDLYTRGDMTLYMDEPHLFTMKTHSSKHQFVGPVHCNEKVPLPSWWFKIPTDKPVIFISSGSSGDEKATMKVLNVLSKMDVSVLLATSGKIKIEDLNAENIFAANYLPGLATAKRSDLIVCNGGSGMVYLGLSTGTPLFCIPTLMDQFIVSEAVVQRGAGLMERSARLNKEKIEKYIKNLLTNDLFKYQVNNFRKNASNLNVWDVLKNIISNQFKLKVPQKIIRKADDSSHLTHNLVKGI